MMLIAFIIVEPIHATFETKVRRKCKQSIARGKS